MFETGSLTGNDIVSKNDNSYLRRDLLALAAGMAAMGPLSAAAQPKVPTIAALIATSSGSGPFWRGFSPCGA